MPPESSLWQCFNEKAREIFQNYNYQEIIIPIAEDAGLFSRSLGRDSEVVEKQMFLIPRKDSTLALRPEGTASVIRSFLENNLDKKTPFVKLYYIGPMFRAERPQKGRLRQFNHIGAEVIGSSNSLIDAEIIALCCDLLDSFGIKGYKIRLNSLGSSKEKQELAKALRKTLKPKLKKFCKDCESRFNRNVFRLLDCKNETCRNNIKSLNLSAEDYLSVESLNHFRKVRLSLDSLGVKYDYDPCLVRGLDYYTGTVFEIAHPNLGAQDAIGAGGRYDNLVKELGGPETCAIGFALGVERLMLAADSRPDADFSDLILYIAAMGEEACKKSFLLASGLRKAGVSVEVDYEDRRLDKKISRASKSGAKFLGILGEDELKKDAISIKDLRKGTQDQVPAKVDSLRSRLC